MVVTANGPLNCLGTRRCSPCLRNELQIPSGHRHEICRGLHAEQHAIAEAARQGIALLDAEMYVTTKPCSVCAKLIVVSGIKRVFYWENFPDSMTEEVLASAGIDLCHLKPGLSQE